MPAWLPAPSAAVAFFLRPGFDRIDWQTLADALRTPALVSDVTSRPDALAAQYALPCHEHRLTLPRSWPCSAATACASW
jgi:hypothetical protein